MIRHWSYEELKELQSIIDNINEMCKKYNRKKFEDTESIKGFFNFVEASLESGLENI